jgi:DNA-binding NtrC family response regulator
VLSARRSIDLDASLRAWESCFVEAALQLTRGNLAHAARMLGMHRTTLYSRMQSRVPVAGEPHGRPSSSA